MSLRVEHLAENVTLYCGRCEDVLPTLGSVSAVITDPPYGVDKAAWDGAFPNATVWSMIASKMTDGASLLVFPGEKAAPYKISQIEGVLQYQWVLVWYASNAMQFGKTGYTKKSLIWWFSKGEPDVKPRMPDLYERAIVPQENNFGHPSPKPINVMLPLVQGFSQVGDCILDTFAGSGSTGVAAIRSERGFIGIEQHEPYFDTACRRIADELKRPRLFAEPAPAYVQGGLGL